jgi:hypothetical protein
MSDDAAVIGGRSLDAALEEPEKVEPVREVAVSGRFRPHLAHRAARSIGVEVDEQTHDKMMRCTGSGSPQGIP